MRYAVSSAMCWSVYTLLWTNVTATFLSLVLVTGDGLESSYFRYNYRAAHRHMI
jgi:hypothetical protein